MSGGLASGTSSWGLGAKTWRAPDPMEREREQQRRLLREAEERKLKELRHEAKALQVNRELELKARLLNNRAVNLEQSARLGGLRRARSFGAVDLERQRRTLELERERARSTEMQMRERERIQTERLRLEQGELARRRQSAMIQAQTAAAANAARLAHSPRIGQLGHSPRIAPIGGLGLSPRMPSLAAPHMGHARHHSLGTLGAGLAGGRPRASSFTGGVRPNLGVGGIAQPPVVNYNTYNISPNSPQAQPLPPPYASPSLRSLQGSPRLGGAQLLSSPNLRAHTSQPMYGANQPHFHLQQQSSPHLGHHQYHQQPFVGASTSPLIDPLVLGSSPPFASAPLFPQAPHQPAVVSSPYIAPLDLSASQNAYDAQAEELFLTDEDHHPQRMILKELGVLQGFAYNDGLSNEDQLIEAAVNDLASKAQMIVKLADYLNSELFLIEANKLPCKFKNTVPDMGHIAGGSDKHLREGTTLELPYWLAGGLAHRDYIDLALPKAYTSRVRNALVADANSVNLRNLGGGGAAFYACGVRLNNLTEDATLLPTLHNAFTKRMVEIMDQSQHSLGTSAADGHAYEYCLTLDAWERELFLVGESTAKEVRDWSQTSKKDK